MTVVFNFVCKIVLKAWVRWPPQLALDIGPACTLNRHPDGGQRMMQPLPA